MIRALLETEAYVEQARELEGMGRRVDEFLEGAKWILERDAEAGTCLSRDTALHVLSMKEVPDHPRLSLFYSIDYDKILLLSLSLFSDRPNSTKSGAPAGL